MDSVVDFDSMYKCSIHFASTKREDFSSLNTGYGTALGWSSHLQ